MPIENDSPERPRRPRRNPSIAGALIVIAVGVFLLIVNLFPQYDAWGVLSRYWPVAIILLGIGKVWEAFQYRGGPADRNNARPASAMPYVVLTIVVLLCVGMWRQSKVQASLHDSHSLDLGAAKNVNARLEMATGELTVAGGAGSLLNADFKYLASDGKPLVDYSIADGRGNINITQPNDSHIRMLNSHNLWDLRFSNQVPLDLDVTLGAGEARLDTRGIDLRNLYVNMGTGELKLDLTGARRQNLTATIKGGIGSADIELPKDVGVSVHAKGGIGAVITHGLTDRDGEYTNASFGKTPATIFVTIEGGIGKIELNEQP
jgi:hypothetical protein